jgi:hypothetical protein
MPIRPLEDRILPRICDVSVEPFPNGNSEVQRVAVRQPIVSARTLRTVDDVIASPTGGVPKHFETSDRQTIDSSRNLSPVLVPHPQRRNENKRWRNELVPRCVSSPCESGEEVVARLAECPREGERHSSSNVGSCADVSLGETERPQPANTNPAVRETHRRVFSCAHHGWAFVAKRILNRRSQSTRRKTAGRGKRRRRRWYSLRCRQID